ncbi:hypothetical protein PybrP1_012194 [[Pythium] brassicae (nom. inval.)]|nr:hypothetical protein PybrP1_012194 [[Pythium] brassicae (nom. inval.)]
MARRDAKFSEVIALIQRNEQAERSVGDAEQDLRRVLLMARDAGLRDELVQFQAVRRIATIWSASGAVTVQRCCAGILGNLAQSERGRLSASSCDRWGCVSHRHRCPLFLLLSGVQCSPDRDLQHLCAAALLAFSVQNECQLQIDAISGIPSLLRLLDCGDAGLGVYAAATMWNLCKSPVLMLKLETTHGILKDQLARRLTDILATPLEPFHLATQPTGERGTTGIIESDSPENLNVLVSCTISTQLTVVLHVENYTGTTRSLTDQFRVLSGPRRRKQPTAQQEGKSVAHFDESGVLVAHSCAVCAKSIKVPRKSARGSFLLCAKENCGQTYHVKCSRWARLDEDDIHPAHFHCDRCMLLQPLYYWDFVADNAQHSELLSENRFRSVAIARVQDAADVMLFNHKQELLGVGKKRFRVPRSSKDDEVFVVAIQFIMVARYPATRQAAPTPTTSSRTTDPEALDCDWHVSYASEEAEAIEFKAGSAMLWPATYALDIAPLLYTNRTLRELENAWIYEFRGEQSVDRVFAFGAGAATSAGEQDAAKDDDTLRGLWTALYPRKGVCVKALAKQVGRAKQQQLYGVMVNDDDTTSLLPVATRTTDTPEATAARSRGTSRKRAKPHFMGGKLNRVAVE